MQLSIPQGSSFIALGESPGGRAVTRAYRCPANVITIGHGYTNASRVFSAYWRQKHGRALQMGDTITQEEADQLLARIVDQEYGAAVNRNIGPKKQHQYDGASSMTFNCGTGATGWKWAQALKRGDVAEAARLLRTTAVTANGRRLEGLVSRREKEAQLIEHGRYQLDGSSTAHSGRKKVRQYQEMLIKLGYDLGPAKADGKEGPATREAVLSFQAEHDLKIDGVVGPATLSTLIRELDRQRSNRSTAGSGAAGGAAGAGSDVVTAPDPASAALSLDALSSMLLWGLGAAAVVFVVFLAIRYRGVITKRRVPVS